MSGALSGSSTLFHAVLCIPDDRRRDVLGWTIKRRIVKDLLALWRKAGSG